MVDFLQSDDILVDVQTESGEVKRIPLWQKAQSAVLGKDYGFDENKIKVISEKVNAQMGLTPEEVKLYREFMTEVAAHETQYLLGTEAFIDKIVASDRSLARKLVDKILNLKEAFSKVGDKATRGQLKMLRQAEKLYLDAARKAGDMRLVKYILSRSPDTEEEIDSDAQIVYNRKGLYKQIPKQEYAIISSRIMEDNSRFMAREEELPRYGAARSANYFYVYENFAPGNFGVLKQIKITDANREYIASIEAKIGENNGESIIGSTSELNRVLEVLKSQARRNRRNNALDSEGRANSDNGGIPLGESEGKRTGDSQKGNGNKQGVRFALKDTVEQDVLAKYGKTYRWTEAGYILKDGTRLDLSGRNEGASGGYRTVDHRDIFDIYEDSEDYGTDAMNQFMARGNIRVMPESPGINLQVEPTEEQYRQIQDLVERLGWKERYFSVDFDDANGDTIDNITYEGAVSARKVVSDIKYFFKEGSIPHQSELSKFRYSLKDSQGNILSEQQQKYFVDSKIRDEQGRLLVVYHGSSKAGFTEFKTELEGSYFTADRKYAEEYAKGNDENVYAVYLNITKPFDTRDAEARRIFEEEFYGQWGNGAPLTDRGLLDWTDGADMFDFLQEKGYDYDGLIIDEGGTPDGIAIEHGSDVYIVDSGRENGSTTFGVRRRRRISDARLRAEFIRSTNNDAISKRFVSDEISSRIGNGLGGDSGRNMRRESRTELQTDSRESQDNQGGVLGENADNGRVSDSDIRFNLYQSLIPHKNRKSKTPRIWRICFVSCGEG